MDAVQVIGIKDLDEEERAKVDFLIDEYYNKIQRMVKNLTSIVLHIKAHKKEGKRKKYSFKLRTVFATKTYETSSSDWDLERTGHMVFKQMMNQIQHKLRPDNQRPKKE